MFRHVARPTESFEISWGEEFEVSPLSRDKEIEIGEFLLRVGAPLLPDCADGTLDGATYYVQRLFDHHKEDPHFELALQASSVVYDRATRQLVGVCMLGGGGEDGSLFGIYDLVVDPSYGKRDLACKMVQRALTVLAENDMPQLHLWHEESSPDVSFYQELGFIPTGEVQA